MGGLKHSGDLVLSIRFGPCKDSGDFEGLPRKAIASLTGSNTLLGCRSSEVQHFCGFYIGPNEYECMPIYICTYAHVHIHIYVYMSELSTSSYVNAPPLRGWFQVI